jgi:gluconokinase
VIVVVMGVSGAGKTTIAELVANTLGLMALDADDFHPEHNVAKLRAGIALNDDDRKPWYALLNARLRQAMADREAVVLACSALTRVYRQWLLMGIAPSQVYWLFLAPNHTDLELRVRQRQHFMPPSLLASQLATLEPPDLGETVVQHLLVLACGDVLAVAGQAMAWLEQYPRHR